MTDETTSTSLVDGRYRLDEVLGTDGAGSCGLHMIIDCVET